MIGIIGGTGFYSLIEDAKRVKVYTPYGAPSATPYVGKINDVEVAFIPRHGEGHTIPPHRVNYRANIWALHELGVERVIGVQAVGSLKEEYRPGEIVFPDQFVDFTKGVRDFTFYEGGRVAHISIPEPFCPEMRDAAIKIAEELRIPYHPKGTYIVIEGPRFSTKAESAMFRTFGDIIGMTLVPEVVLARELGMCYLSIAMITDYDVWKDKPVDTREVIETMKANEEKVRKILAELVPAISGKRKCSCGETLKNAFI